MVRNVDDLDFQLPSHAQDVLDGLQRLRGLPRLTDVTLLVGGRELPCHRGLLALSSPYFHAMFTGDFSESCSARVELRDVEPAAVGQLVDFAYTGRLRITQSNVEALTRTASRLHFPAVQKVCGRYLQQQLDATNCLGICEFGEQQGLLGVAAKAWAFLRENFEAVAREDEFLQLPRDRLAACLAGDLLQVQPEQSRLQALLRWARHDPQSRAAHLPGLLGLVHLDAVPRPHVQQLLATEPLIQDSEACQEALSQGHAGVPPAPAQKLEEVLVVVGGRALEEEEAGEDPAPQPGNFAFYNSKASEAVDGAPRLPRLPQVGLLPGRTPQQRLRHRWLPGHKDGHLVNHPGLVLPAEGGGLEAGGTDAEGPHQPRQCRAQRGDLRHRRHHPGRGGGGELRPLHRQLGARQPGAQVRQQLLGGRLRGPALPGGLQRLQVQHAGAAVLQPHHRRVEHHRLALPAQVPVLAALRRPARRPLPHRGQHQEGLRVRPGGQPVAEGAVPAQPARERRAGAPGGRTVRDGRPLAGHGRRLPRGDGGLRHRAGRLDAPRRAAPPLALPWGLLHLPGRVQVDAALRPRPGALGGLGGPGPLLSLGTAPGILLRAGLELPSSPGPGWTQAPRTAEGAGRLVSALTRGQGLHPGHLQCSRSFQHPGISEKGAQGLGQLRAPVDFPLTHATDRPGWSLPSLSLCQGRAQ